MFAEHARTGARRRLADVATGGGDDEARFALAGGSASAGVSAASVRSLRDELASARIRELTAPAAAILLPPGRITMTFGGAPPRAPPLPKGFLASLSSSTSTTTGLVCAGDRPVLGACRAANPLRYTPAASRSRAIVAASPEPSSSRSLLSATSFARSLSVRCECSVSSVDSLSVTGRRDETVARRILDLRWRVSTTAATTMAASTAAPPMAPPTIAPTGVLAAALVPPPPPATVAAGTCTVHVNGDSEELPHALTLIVALLRPREVTTLFAEAAGTVSEKVNVDAVCRARRRSATSASTSRSALLLLQDPVLTDDENDTVVVDPVLSVNKVRSDV